MTYSQRQDPWDAFEAERWFADPKLFRDCRFDGQKWVGPAPIVAQINSSIPAVDSD